MFGHQEEIPGGRLTHGLHGNTLEQDARQTNGHQSQMGLFCPWLPVNRDLSILSIYEIYQG